MKNNLSSTVFWSVSIIFSILFLLWLVAWKPIKEYFITEFWKSMSEKEYQTQLLTELLRDPASVFNFFNTKSSK